MMKILLPALLALSTAAFAQSSSEEAIILNQEMMFLENSAKDLRIDPKISEAAEKELSPDEMSLERTYFQDSERDEIRSRAAAPRRRSF